MTGISTLGQALSQINRINVQQSQLNSLTTQLSTGKITQRFSGLGNDIVTSQRARASFQSLEVYTNNITNASRRISLSLNSIQEFQAQSRNLEGVIDGFSQETAHEGLNVNILTYDDPTTTTIEEIQIGLDSAEVDGDFRNLQQFASDVFEFFETLLNVKDGDRYLFGGSETNTQPFTDTGTLDSAIDSLITDWKGGTITTDDLIQNLTDRDATQNPRAISDSIVGFSPQLSSGNARDVFVRVDDGQDIKYTVLANEQPFRDILVAASYLKSASLGPIGDVYEPPNVPAPPFSPDVEGAPGANLDEQKENFFAVINSLSAVINNALDDIDLVSFRVGSAQGRITEIQNRHAEEQNLLQGVIADVEDADQNEVALKINTLLTQLETSFAVTSRVQQLSLVNFI